MSTAFLIGNGLSRKPINLCSLKGTTYGCNAIYTEFFPDYIVILDKYMIIEALSNNINNLYTTKKARDYYVKLNLCNKENINILKNTNITLRNSGLISLNLALEKLYTTIYFIGWDLYTNIEKRELNNMYRDHSCYIKNCRDHDPNVRQVRGLINTINKNTCINFIRVVDYEYSANLEEYIKGNKSISSNTKINSNYKEITVEEFKKDHGC